MQIYYIRHGQSTNNRLYVETGSDKGRSEDPILTELGWQQARLLAKHVDGGRQGIGGQAGHNDLHEYNLTHIYTSLMTRALQTASILAAEVQLSLIGMAALHEVGGVYLEDEESGELIGKSGKTPAALRTEFPDLILPAGLPDSGWYSRPFEMREERLPRAKAVLDELIDRHGASTDRIALVSHGGFYQYFITAVLDLMERTQVWFALDNTAITRIDFNERFEVIYTNRTTHLPADLLT